MFHLISFHRPRGRWPWFVVALGLLLALAAMPVAALERRSGEGASLAAGETIDDNLALAGPAITVAGHVTGDLFAAGNSVTILSGARIEGDVFAAGNSVTVAPGADIGGSLYAAGNTVINGGTLGGSARVAGNAVQLTGPIGRNVLAGGNQVMLAPTAAVKGNLMAGATDLVLQGPVTGTVTGGGTTVTLAGPIGRQVELTVENLIVQPGARLSGDLTYTAPREYPIPAGTVQGQVQRLEPPARPAPAQPQPDLAGFAFSLVLLAGTAIVALLQAWLFPGLYRAGQAVVERRALLAFATGLITLIVVPVLAIILLITIFGLPLGVLGLGAYFAGWYVGWLLAAAALAGVVVDRLRPDRAPLAPAWLVLIGLVVLHLLTRVPVVGGVLTFGVLCLGLGTVVLLLVEWRQRTRPPAVPAPTTPVAA